MEEKYNFDLNLRPRTTEDWKLLILEGKDLEIKKNAFLNLKRHNNFSIIDTIEIYNNTEDEEIKILAEHELENKKIKYFLSLLSKRFLISNNLEKFL